MSASAEFRRPKKSSLFWMVLVCAVFVSLCVASLIVSLHSVVMRHYLEITDEQRELLKADSHISFYSARLYESLGSGHVLRQLPRYQAISVIVGYFRLFPDSYGQTVAQHLPFRVTMTPPEYDAGLDSAAARLFALPIQDITSEQLTVLITYSLNPAQNPLATTKVP